MCRWPSSSRLPRSRHLHTGRARALLRRRGPARAIVPLAHEPDVCGARHEGEPGHLRRNILCQAHFLLWGHQDQGVQRLALYELSVCQRDHARGRTPALPSHRRCQRDESPGTRRQHWRGADARAVHYPAPVGPAQGTPPLSLIFPIFLPHLRLCGVVSLYMRVLPYKCRKILEMMIELRSYATCWGALADVRLVGGAAVAAAAGQSNTVVYNQNQNGAKSGFELCFDPSTLGPGTMGTGAKTRLESSMKKFQPHLNYPSYFFSGQVRRVRCLCGELLTRWHHVLHGESAHTVRIEFTGQFVKI